MNPLRSLILAAGGNDSIRRAVATIPATRGLVERFVAGETVADAVTVVGDLVDNGRYVTLDYLGEDVRDPGQAERTVQTYLTLLDRLYDEGLAARAEVSVKLSAVGLCLDEKLALDNVWRICAAAEQCATTVTLDMEDHRTTDATLRALDELRHTWPWVGAVLQSSLNRTENDAVTLAVPDSRVRLCKGAYAEPREVAWRSRHQADLAYVRAANILLAGAGYPMFATHDPRLIDILGERIRWHGRKPGSYEYQMLYGVRPGEQARLTAEGELVRVYVPFGEQWYGYLMRRLAERPANLAFFLRALVSRS
ncbi:proline dehydrogenase family protein [Amycolatopsis sp.]|uniref:proline dehydrogenase family protein n=1 Tax=Amycolatopsis sp. TaxID=37632 RepID=UPI002CC21347|nr:proline dehydrogenase family protein [Amycolatopsis sp.]HVV11106.1 proline dehydrogenase family protein [Amycolatopsis sp.]